MNCITQIIDGKVYTFQLTLISVVDVVPALEFAPTNIVLATVCSSPKKVVSIADEEDDDDDDEKKLDILDVIESGCLSTLINICKDKFEITLQATVNSLTDKILDDMYKTTSQEYIIETMPRVRKILNDQTNTVNTLSDRFCILRTILKNRFGEHSDIVVAHKGQGLTRDQYEMRRAQDEAARNKNLETKVTIDRKHILEIIASYAASYCVWQNIIAIQLATGARMIEVIKVSEFKEISGLTDVIEVVGVAKSKDDKQRQIRPILELTARALIELVENVREIIVCNLNNEKTTAKYINSLNLRVGKMNVEGIHTSKCLRKVYVALTQNIDDQHLHAQKVLGHKSISASAHYATMNVLPAEVPVKLLNVRGEEVQIFLSKHIGTAPERCASITQELFDNNVFISEAVLKKNFNFGGKTLALTADSRRALREAQKRLKR
jgi:hypothetical protein